MPFPTLYKFYLISLLELSLVITLSYSSAITWKRRREGTCDWFVMGLTASVEQASGFSSWFCDTTTLGCFWSSPQSDTHLSNPCLQASTEGKGVSYDKSPLIKLMASQTLWIQSEATSPTAQASTESARKGKSHCFRDERPRKRVKRGPANQPGPRSINDPWLLDILKTQMKVLFEVNYRVQNA